MVSRVFGMVWVDLSLGFVLRHLLQNKVHLKQGGIADEARFYKNRGCHCIFLESLEGNRQLHSFARVQTLNS